METSSRPWDTRLLLALTIYLTSLIAANTLGQKLLPFVLNTTLSAAFISFPFVFLTTDVVGEVYGKAVAKKFVLAGFVASALFAIYTAISLAFPWSERGIWLQESYNTVFSISLRSTIASFIAFVLASYQDVISFFFFRARMGTRFFWIRSTLSNLWSQLLDTVIFMLIAFYGIYSTDTLVRVIFTWWLYKVAMGGLYTPLSYIGLRLLRAEPKQTA
jgi:uncharacterized integral membrane protein (TIGR00697 family)